MMCHDKNRANEKFKAISKSMFFKSFMGVQGGNTGTVNSNVSLLEMIYWGIYFFAGQESC